MSSFRPRNFILCSIGLSLAVFMQILDTTIANVSLPTIAGNLGASAQQSTWVVTAFTVSNAIALPITGWFARRIGEVRLFIASTLLFTIFSMLCGMAPSMGMLTVFRAIQGFVAGPIYPATQALMISIFPDNKRAQALVTISIIGVLGPIIGPILGGWLTDNYSWPWIFFINVPVGAFACYVVWTQMKDMPQQTKWIRMDYIGLASLALGVGALQIMLDMGNDEDWFSSDFIVASAIIAAISLAVFLIWELNEKEPVVDLHLFRHRNFSFGAVCNMLVFGTYFGGGVLVPLWLQTQLHYTPVWAGLAMASGGVFSILLAPVLGKYMNRVDARLLASFAIAFLAISFYLRSGFNLDVDFAHVAWLQFFQGLGVLLFFTPMAMVTLSDLKPNEISAGVGLSMFLRTLGGSFGVSVTTYLWNSRAVLHHSQLAEQFVPGSASTFEAVRSLGHGSVPLTLERLDLMITAQAYQISFNELLFGATLLLMAVSFTIWLTKRPISG